MNYFEQANYYYNTKEYERAIELYQKSINLNENEAASYYNSGVCLIKLKQYEKAIHLIKKAIEIKRDSKYFFNLAYCYAMLKDSKKALIYFNTSWSIDNSDKDCERAIQLIMQKYKKNIL